MSMNELTNERHAIWFLFRFETVKRRKPIFLSRVRCFSDVIMTYMLIF